VRAAAGSEFVLAWDMRFAARESAIFSQPEPAFGRSPARAANSGCTIRQPQPIADRQFEIEFFGPAVEAFAFTFG
jgi:hypothetical protein